MSVVRQRFPRLRPFVAGVALAAASFAAQAQNLQQLYEAARNYDATYLAVALAAAVSVLRALATVAFRRGAAVMPQPVRARAGALRRAAITLGSGVVALLWLL